ncbi:unnamed protein product [Caenorhabditis sp. 36 PRJEB53466]|nr:unnamed protein product [Caenorhabditis sp. 36 PRJEB53466]
MNAQEMLDISEIHPRESESPEMYQTSLISTFRMETRKVRTPSARLLAAKLDEDKGQSMSIPTPKAASNNLASQLAKVGETSTPVRNIPSMPSNASSHESNTTSRLSRMEKEQSPMDEEIDISNTEMEDTIPKSESRQNVIQVELLKPEKIGSIVLNSDFPVSNEVTISSMKYTGRPNGRKVAYHHVDKSGENYRTGFTGETLNLKSSDLSIPNKAAHFLYFRCYDESEVQKEFPLTIDENRKGPQNFLVEPRVGLKNTDYYIDSYLWNRGKSTSSKKKIFVEIDGNHVKTSRRSIESAHYLLNWYYSNMENRICKKVCWLETTSDGVRASPVLVQYHVNYLSDNPIELRKTPKLYSDTRSVAQELLRSDSPLQTVARFVETGETDPREIINKKQAYEMRRYVMASARKRQARKREFEESGMFYDDEMYEEVYYDEQGEPVSMPPTRARDQTEASRIAHMACRIVGRKIENRIASYLDNRLGQPKGRDVQSQAEMLTEWINTLDGTTPDDYDIAIHSVVASMRKHLDEILSPDHEYIVDTGSTSKRRHHIEEDEGTSGKQPRFEGESFIFEGEYVEEEVIAEELAEGPSTSANGESSTEVKFERAEGPTFFFPTESGTDVTVDQ